MEFKKRLPFITTPERSALMSRIRSTETKAEIKLRTALWGAGFRYRINYKKLPGSPDILMNKYKVAIFIDGEFWHGYNWEEKKQKIKTNRDFWIPKIERTIQRDLANNAALKEMGYIVIRFWEHEIKKDLNGCVVKILEVIKKAGG